MLPVRKTLLLGLLCITLGSFPSCRQKNIKPSAEQIREIELKRGQLVYCGSGEDQFGSAEFEITASEQVKEKFNLGVNLLHSFEYDEAEKVFSGIIDKEPACAMAYWGIAMSNFHPLWTPPSASELKKGALAIQIAQSLEKSERESAYIAAIGSFYNEWNSIDHRTRCLRFENGMKSVFLRYPDDEEAAVFYALALNAAADPNDKSFSRQRKAGSILQAVFSRHPDHPGVAHYLIHTYDYPELAEAGLSSARRYASVAPSSAHALHMPSHIFTRLGLWDECIKSNLASVYSAKCYAEAADIKGHWDEELHGMDYLTYAYLQKGENDSARKQLEYLKTITEVYPVNFKVAYAYAAIPSRIVIENKNWSDAANLKLMPENFPWNNFPWQEAIIHFTRLLGAVHTDQLNTAKGELDVLRQLKKTLELRDLRYEANQVAIQIKSSEAWIRLKEGKTNEAVELMTIAAEMEGRTEKHPVTPCEVVPAQELLGDMLMVVNRHGEALKSYEVNLKKTPNRFNSNYGAALAAERSGDVRKANNYFQRFLVGVGNTSDRPEISIAKNYLNQHSIKY